LRTQGISERQAAKEIKVPRTTLPAWRVWHDTLDICPHVAEFFQSGPGLAFLHRIVIAFHLVCVEVGACGIRLVCLFLNLTGLNRFVAASYGAQQQVNFHVEHAMVTYHQDETARLAQDMPQKDLTVTQDETFTGGLCLITMDPESNFILLEQLAQARDQTSWNAWMEPALAQFNCRVIQSTSDEAPGLLAYVEHYLEAHHSPDLFHVQHELVKAVSAPMGRVPVACGEIQEACLATVTGAKRRRPSGQHGVTAALYIVMTPSTPAVRTHVVCAGHHPLLLPTTTACSQTRWLGPRRHAKE
jgi:hypothetical protein